ncbi:MAG: hypothetical protein ABI947_11020 [Chloroflexota bacterium]
MFKLPTSPKRLSLITLLYGISAFLWLSIEDTGWLVVVFGIGLALLTIVHGLFRLSITGKRTLPTWMWLPTAAAIGALAGVGSIAATLLLMLMKISLHGHLYPDYTFPLLSGLAARLPAWALAGLLIGLAVGLAFYGRRRGPSDEPGAGS